MDSWIIVGIIAVSLASILVYVVLMFFLPEWVGITGAVAKKAIESHVEEGAEGTQSPSEPA
ncbi:MAG: hypothetical protein JSU04_18410 [Bdellovibrionales bacterium]|nr:hypothetical protein [Bdellovibrionales bacterium]